MASEQFVRLKAPFKTGTACTGDPIENFHCTVKAEDAPVLMGPPFNFQVVEQIDVEPQAEVAEPATKSKGKSAKD